MAIRNVHERRYHASAAEVGALLDSLASTSDRLWPHDRWPAMRLDRPLGPGATGGHGPIRYAVETYEPGRLIRFRFTQPRGFIGSHAFVVCTDNGEHTVLRHELTMSTSGAARVTWPIVFRPLHDALIEDALDKAGSALGEAPALRPWSLQVRMLRGIVRNMPRRRRSSQ